MASVTMRYLLVLHIVGVTLFSQSLEPVNCAEDAETEWRPEAQRVALEALAKKYPKIVKQDVDVEIYRYSTSSVSFRKVSLFQPFLTLAFINITSVI